ncbi:PEPxxWA-CTERM sorting domain-containing protein [Phenylobacterium sp.]|uniref:PEPxxWA-CTERM sorting domain-containing protein n=1 Tax=Phenylobacterium sp. TaxID=1871053 RepID=UPI002CFB7DEB|nr:PEPxxWA-CTERM sorting domain-containing protein [Phenylobacterium sp.]HLZ77026.1 PEPxxWA-CTERM sorting domain-containing protein [Phenylobacterium sp.]
MKTILLASAAVLVMAAPASAAVTFDYLSLTTVNTTAAAAGNGLNAASYTFSNGHAFADAFSLPGSPLTTDATATVTATTSHLVVTPVHHPDTFAPSDIHHLHPIHHPDTFITTTTTVTNADATATEGAVAAFTDAGDATFAFLGNTVANVYTAGSAADVFNGGQKIRYDFSIDHTSVLDLTYDLSESFNFPNAHNFLSLTDLTTHTTLFAGALGNNTAGDLNLLLAGNHHFDLTVFSSPMDDRALRTTIGQTLGSHEEFYSWAVNAVPEPATWAMMIFGFGGVGAIMRRRRIAPAMA